MRDRQVAGRHVPPHLLVRLGEELHEPGDARVVGRLLALHDPEGRAPDDRVLLPVGRAPVRQLARAPLELQRFLEAADDGGRLDEHGAVAVDELWVWLAHAAAVGEDAFLLPGRELTDVLHAFAQNPTAPAYDARWQPPAATRDGSDFLDLAEGIHTIGHDGRE